MIVHCRLTPRGSQDVLLGSVRLADGQAALAAKVRAVPEHGKANLALLQLLAQALDLPVSRLELIAGAAGRLKTVAIDGEPDRLEATLRRIVFPHR